MLICDRNSSSGPTVCHRYFTYFCFKTFRAQLFLLKNDTFSLLMFLTGNEMNEIKENFEAKGCPGFPGIIGVIDGTHIRIRAPTRHPDAYINRKKFHSLGTQVNSTFSAISP